MQCTLRPYGPPPVCFLPTTSGPCRPSFRTHVPSAWCVAFRRRAIRPRSPQQGGGARQGSVFMKDLVPGTHVTHADGPVTLQTARQFYPSVERDSPWRGHGHSQSRASHMACRLDRALLGQLAELRAGGRPLWCKSAVSIPCPGERRDSCPCPQFLLYRAWEIGYLAERRTCRCARHGRHRPSQFQLMQQQDLLFLSIAVRSLCIPPLQAAQATGARRGPGGSVGGPGDGRNFPAHARPDWSVADKDSQTSCRTRNVVANAYAAPGGPNTAHA